VALWVWHGTLLLTCLLSVLHGRNWEEPGSALLRHISWSSGLKSSLQVSASFCLSSCAFHPDSAHKSFCSSSPPLLSVSPRGTARTVSSNNQAPTGGLRVGISHARCLLALGLGARSVSKEDTSRTNYSEAQTFYC
jgi:hypothetical protein